MDKSDERFNKKIGEINNKNDKNKLKKVIFLLDIEAIINRGNPIIAPIDKEIITKKVLDKNIKILSLISGNFIVI